MKGYPLLFCCFQGFKNDFKAAMDKVDAEYLNEILKSGNDKSEDAKSTDVKVKDDGVTMDEILVIIN